MDLFDEISIFNMTPDPVAFTVFGFDIRWYGILITVGIVVATAISMYRAPRHGISPDRVLDVIIWSVPIGIVGARAYYVFFQWDNYAGDLKSILNIRQGGLAIHGGLIFGIGTAVILCLLWRIRPFNLMDLVLPCVALAQAIGRWGNFFNSEAHGGPTDLPWGILVDGVKVHPTFLYESLWCLLLFVVLSVIDRHRTFEGQVACLYGILYSLERFFVESLRTDSLMLGGLKQAQVISLVIIAVCAVLYVVLYKKSRRGASIYRGI